MAYRHDTWTFPGSKEHEYKWAGNYGAKGEKRQAKERASPERIRKQNQRNREKRLRRKIKANFQPGDLWITLKYPKGTRKPLGEVKKDFKRFRDALRKAYRRQGEELKYIYRMEIGRRGGIHIHILVNRVSGKPDTDVIAQRAWKYGRIHFESIYEQGGYEDLADYITKQPDEEIDRQISLFPEEERKQLISYSCSRNLKDPVPEQKEYRHWTMRKILMWGPEPTKGYYIDPDSVVQGVNPFTGMSYLQYTEYPIKQGRDSPERRETMQTVDIYVGTSIRGAGRGDGKVCYVMSTKMRDCTVHESHPSMAAYDDATEARLVLYACRDAIQRLKYACRVVIHTECGYIISAITLRWPWDWRKNGWKTSRGNDPKDSVLWADILNAIEENGHELTAEEDRHDYLEWMRWKFGTERPLRNIFTEIKDQ